MSRMITLTYEYKLVPTPEQKQIFDDWLKICSSVWNFALRERKDWANSRKCDNNSCSIHSEYIIPVDVKRPTYASQCKALTAAKKEYPALKIPQSQVLQQVLKNRCALRCLFKKTARSAARNSIYIDVGKRIWVSSIQKTG